MSIMKALKKGVGAAANAGADMATENFRAKLLAERDARLNSYDRKNQADNRTFQSSERAASQTFTANENAENRTFQGNENAAGRALQEEGLGIQRDELGLRREQQGVVLQQAEQALEAGQMDIAQKKQIQEYYETALDDSASDEVRARAIENLDVMLGKGGDNYQATTLYGDENDSGEQTKATGILNRRTGTITPASPQSAVDLTSPDAVRSAFQQGRITREKATELLQQFDQ